MNNCNTCFWQFGKTTECFSPCPCEDGSEHRNKEYPTVRLALNDIVENAGGMQATWEQDYKQSISLKRTLKGIEHCREVTVHLFERNNAKTYRIYDAEGNLYWIDDKVFSNESKAPRLY